MKKTIYFNKTKDENDQQPDENIINISDTVDLNNVPAQITPAKPVFKSYDPAGKNNVKDDQVSSNSNFVPLEEVDSTTIKDQPNSLTDLSVKNSEVTEKDTEAIPEIIDLPKDNNTNLSPNNISELNDVRTSIREIIENDTDELNRSKISKDVEEFIQIYKDIIEYESRSIQHPIHVDELASRVARFYEQIRRVIDWKEEHLIRRTAIERVLKRRLISETSAISKGVESDEIAEPIVMELVRSGYFKNDSISQNAIPYVEEMLAKYIYIIKKSQISKKDIKTKMHFYNWIIEIAACELEDILDPLLKEFALLNLMTESIYSHLEILPEGKITNEEKFIQTYIASHRTLYNMDDSVITYHLLQYKYKNWNHLDNESIKIFTDDIENIWKDLELQLNDKIGAEFFSVCDKYDAVYLILGDIMHLIEEDKADFEEVLSDEKKLDEYIDKTYSKRLSTLKGRLARSATYSTLSIFLAGGVTMFIVEVPLAKLVHGRFSPLAMLVDTLLPALMMFLLVSIIKLPPSDNLEKLRGELKKLVSANKQLDEYLIKINKKKNVFLNTIFFILYAVSGILSLIFVFWIFKLVRVPWTSLYVDTVNVAVVVFTAMIIKQRSREITIGKDGTLANFIMNLFTIPLAKIGKWFANVWKEYNFVSAFFTALVDTPISIFIEIIEDWRNFIDDQGSDLH